LIIMAVAFAVTIPFFFLGSPSGHDFEFHLLSWMEVVHQWKQGIRYPRWAQFAHWNYGEARFIFYPPTSWNLGALLGVILPWKIVPAVYTWIALSASGFSMFLLSRRWLSERDAIFAAVLYAANPYYLVVVYWRSAQAELLAGCLLPLLLLLVLRTEEEGSHIILPLSLVLAAVWLTNAPTAMMVNYSLALLLVVAPTVKRKPRLLLYGASAVILAAALASFYIVPAAYEEKWVNLSAVLAPGVRPEDNFLFTNIADDEHNRFNLLISIIAVAEMLAVTVAIYLSRGSRKDQPGAWWTLTAWAAASALVMLPITRIFWEQLPNFRYVQLPWRWLLCLNVAFSVLVTIAFRRWLMRLLLYTAMLALLWGLWHRVQQPWWDTAADIEEMHDAIEDGVGYEGVDEYVPARADPYDLNKDAKQVTVVSGRAASIGIKEWTAESKVFTVDVSRPEQLRLRLFNYPAWKAEINGRAGGLRTQPGTGEIVIPVSAGTNEVTVTLVQSPDRLAGGLISLLALLVAVFLWIRQCKPGLPAT
jgi:6-pyruvoyl-tetrahydropterin synthase related domain